MAIPDDLYIALGSNLGQRELHLSVAAQRLTACDDTELVSRSSVYETSPVGGPAGQGQYLNAVICLRTFSAPRRMLDRCLEIERILGRRRSERNGPRTIDLDLLLADRSRLTGGGTAPACQGSVIDSDGLTLPHPRLHERRFVLEPLAEIAPDLIHPVLRRSIRAILADLPDSSERVVRVTGPDWGIRIDD